jgi:hypothetical protein
MALDGWIDGWAGELMGGWMGGWMSGWVRGFGWMDRRTGGRTDRHIFLSTRMDPDSVIHSNNILLFLCLQACHYFHHSSHYWMLVSASLVLRFGRIIMHLDIPECLPDAEQRNYCSPGHLRFGTINKQLKHRFAIEFCWQFLSRTVSKYVRGALRHISVAPTTSDPSPS